MAPKKLFLLDAYALIYRSYFAFIRNPRINSRGINTSASYGFTNTILEVINKEKPTHIAVVFDTKEPTQRHLDYPEYKAHREEMPEGLRNGLPQIDELLEALNITKIFKSGYEADDIIGTIAKKAEKEGFETYMMTSDKDFAQLVSEKIYMYKPGNKWRPTETWGVKEVLENFKIDRVEQIIDYLGLMGDSADNIPGIQGVGKKTAQKLIKQFGSIEQLFKNTELLKGRLRETVLKGKENCLLSRKLVTIDINVPLDINLEELLIQEKNTEKLIKLFTKLEFNRLIQRVIKKESLEQKKSQEEINVETNQISLFSKQEITVNNKNKEIEEVSAKINIVSSIDKIKEFIKTRDKSKLLSFHINLAAEKNKREVFSITLTNLNGESIIVSLNDIDSKRTKDILSLFFENNKIKLVGYEIKNTLKYLNSIGINQINSCFDISIANHLLQPDKQTNIKSLSKQLLNIELKEEPIYRENIELNNEEKKNIFKYLIHFTKVLVMLYEPLKNKLVEDKIYTLFKEVEMPLISVLSKIETEGITIDKQKLFNYSKDLEKTINEIEKKIFALSGCVFNLSSPKQLGRVLFEELKILEKPKKTKSGQYSTSEDVLSKIINSHPIIKFILEFREINKLLSTYVNALPKLVVKNKIHTTYKQNVTSTGRLSSVNPNLQNIPVRTANGKKIRMAFIPSSQKHKILCADYSQIELRIIAAMSNDMNMIESFINNQDIHSNTASKVFKVPLSDVDNSMRSKAKSVNFGIIYGISAFGLSQNIGISRNEAKQLIDDYFHQFKNVKEYMDSSIDFARKNEYVKTLLGRRRYLPEINSRNAFVRGVAERNAINSPIQGTAADIIKKAMIDIQNEISNRKLRSKMILQVHDELIFDMLIEEQEELSSLIKQKMENVIDLNVPLSVDIGIGDNWLEAH